MSIDARVKAVYVPGAGSGRIELVDRPPARPGDYPGVAGQSVLYFVSAPEEVTALNGLDVWGNASCLMLGEKRIAARIGYTGIQFVGPAEFKEAVAAYHQRVGRAEG
jgi:hypothetical protein